MPNGFPHDILMPNGYPATSNATVKYLRQLFRHFGAPETIVSDNGLQFTSTEFATFCAEHNIVHLRSSPRMPQSNGLAERMVQTLKKSMDKATENLDVVVTTYNYTPHSELENKSPAEVFFGRKIRTPFDIFKPKEANNGITPRQIQMKQQFDNHHNARHRKFKEGEKVMIELWNGKRVNGTISKLIGKTMAEVQVGNEKQIRHYNQIWKRHIESNLWNDPNMELDSEDTAPEDSNENELQSAPQPKIQRPHRQAKNKNLDYRTLSGFRRNRSRHIFTTGGTVGY